MDAIQRLTDEDAVARLHAKDPTLFSAEDAAARLGWVGLASATDPVGAQTRELAETAERLGITDIVLLGMGGSSLAPLVIASVLASGPDHPRLHVLDTTAPATVLATLGPLPAATTWVVVASKSGVTIEPLWLYSVFRQWMQDRVVSEPAGRHFVAITDPGSPLQELAERDGFRAVVPAPADVGGRFSALTAFGLAPAALIRADIAALVASAREMERLCAAPPAENPAARLAAFVADAHAAGRDKLTLVTSTELRPFGLWVEQLIAESTGKEGTGVVPVLETSPGIPTGFGADRAVVVLRLEDDDMLASWAGLAAEEGAPAHEIVLAGPLELGGEFVRWEYATALLGSLLGVDPFIQPNVAEAKEATSAILEGRAQAPAPAYTVDQTEITYAGPLKAPAAPPALAEALDPLLDALRPGDYLAFLVYLPEDDALFEPLRRCAKAVSMTTGRAVCLEIGPRYLHSTGQLHKGGPAEGAFLMLTAPADEDLGVPGERLGLAALWRAQAEGDFVTLAAHGRRVLRVHLPSADAGRVRDLADTLTAVAEAGVRA